MTIENNENNFLIIAQKEEMRHRKERMRENLVEAIIQLSAEGKIKWDFSHFDDSVFGQEARAEYEGITFVCCDWQDTGVEFDIITREKEEDKKQMVDSFGGKRAMRLRHFLGLMASKDPTLQQIRREEKAKYRKLEEAGRKELEENTKKLGEIVQLLRLQS